MKKGAYSTGKVIAYVKERLVICNEEVTDGEEMTKCDMSDIFYTVRRLLYGPPWRAALSVAPRLFVRPSVSCPRFFRSRKAAETRKVET